MPNVFAVHVSYILYHLGIAFVYKGADIRGRHCIKESTPCAKGNKAHCPIQALRTRSRVFACGQPSNAEVKQPAFLSLRIFAQRLLRTCHQLGG